MLFARSAVVQWLGYLAFTQKTRVQTPAAESIMCGAFFAKSSPAGNRTRVTRVTGGYTNLYTTEDLGVNAPGGVRTRDPGLIRPMP